MMAQPGGLRVEDALSRANKALDLVRDACLAAIDSHIADLDAFVRGRSIDGLGAAYHAAKEIYGLSGTHGLSELSNGAHSLCELLSRIEGDDPVVPWMIAQVHVDALKKLRHPSLGADAPARIAIVEGLRMLSARGP